MDMQIAWKWFFLIVGLVFIVVSFRMKPTKPGPKDSVAIEGPRITMSYSYIDTREQQAKERMESFGIKANSTKRFDFKPHVKVISVSINRDDI